MELKEIREKRGEFTEAIYQLSNKFEQETGCYIEHIDYEVCRMYVKKVSSPDGVDLEKRNQPEINIKL